MPDLSDGEQRGPIRLAIADDNAAMLDTLARVLGDTGGVEVVLRAADGPALFDALDDERPDVVLLDLRLGGEWGLDLVPRIRAMGGAPEVVIYSAVVGTSTAEQATAVGVFRQLVKGAPLAEVRAAVIEAAARHRRG